MEMTEVAVGRPGLLEGRLPVGDCVPEWLCEMRRKAWSEFESLPMPKRTDETWRFSNLKSLSLEGFEIPAPLTSERAGAIVTASRPVGAGNPRIVFANGHVAEVSGISGELEACGVVFGSLMDLLESHGDIIRGHFMVQGAHLGSDKFAALHQAYTESGTLLYIPRGVKVEVPFEVFHWMDGGSVSVFPHTLLIAEPGSEVTLVDHFRAVGTGEPGFACAVNDLYVGEGAKATYICDQQWGSETLSFQMNSTIVEKDAHATSLNLNIGGKYARMESRSRMNGTGSRSDMLGVTVADGDQIFDLRTAQDHGERNTTSDLLYKNALADRSKSIFSGIIRVEEGAHQTDAYQTNRSLVLSDEAESDSMPGLEILADDVKCSHGSTAGSVSDEEMFYLQARGIPRRDAEHLVVVGFLNEVLQRLPESPITGRLLDSIESKFRNMQN